MTLGGGGGEGEQSRDSGNMIAQGRSHIYKAARNNLPSVSAYLRSLGVGMRPAAI